MRHLILLMCLCVVLGTSTTVEVLATTIYSYIDDQGTPVFTDSPETIPDKYREKVKTHEQPGSVGKTPSKIQSMQQKLQEGAKSFGWEMPTLSSKLNKFSLGESPILNYAGIAAIVLLLIMYLSKNSPMIRLLALGLLIVLGIGTPVLMYTSDGGPMDILKKKAVASGHAQQDRLQQTP
ncbi:MAG: DUF4124 domain-containing protein [Nitrospira sp.]|nr:DUF4124 domain-containing protein [Nitrospira sp.]